MNINILNEATSENPVSMICNYFGPSMNIICFSPTFPIHTFEYLQLPQFSYSVSVQPLCYCSAWLGQFYTGSKELVIITNTLIDFLLFILLSIHHKCTHIT